MPDAGTKFGVLQTKFTFVIKRAHARAAEFTLITNSPKNTGGLWITQKRKAAKNDTN